MPREIDNKTQNISVLQLKFYFMFLKCKQTQPACVKNEHAIDYIQNSSLDKGINHRRNRHSTFIPVVLLINIQQHLLFSNDFRVVT